MHDGFLADFSASKSKSSIYYDEKGFRYDKLLEFHFCSSFTCLKDKFNLDSYILSKSSIFINKDEAAKILQAIEYILGNEYSKRLEDILSNEYINILGHGYSLFDNRFNKHKDKIYIDKNGSDGYILSVGDDSYDLEIAECDDDVKFSLSRAASCLHAFFDAEANEWNGYELVLEYSAY